MLRHLAHQVPGNQHVLMDLGAYCVGGDGPVAQAGHQHQPGGGDVPEQLGHLAGHRPDRPLENALLPAGQALQGEGDIGPPGLAQGFLPPAVQHPDGVYRDALPQGVMGLHPGQGGGGPRPLLPQLSGLQGQVGPSHAHGFLPPYAICCGIIFIAALVFAALEKLSPVCKKNQKNS